MPQRSARTRQWSRRSLGAAREEGGVGQQPAASAESDEPPLYTQLWGVDEPSREIDFRGAFVVGSIDAGCLRATPALGTTTLPIKAASN